MSKTCFAAAQPKLLHLWAIWIACVFFGRAWQALMFELPLTTLFWDEYLLSAWVERLTGLTWEEYVQYPAWLGYTSKAIGGLWLLAGGLCLSPYRDSRLGRFGLHLGALALLFLWFLLWKGKFWNFGELIEHFLQMAGVWLLLYAPKLGERPWALTLQSFIALTFIGHAFYACNWHPISGEWLAWCGRILGLEQAQALNFLWFMGILDILAALGLFWSRSRSLALAYCIIWGFLTALARVVANFFPEVWLVSLHDWLFETVYRLVHGGGPLLLFYWYKTQKKATFSPELA